VNDQWRAEGVPVGATAPGFQAGGIQGGSLKSAYQNVKNRVKCIKSKEKMVASPGIQDKGGIPGTISRNESRKSRR